MLQYLFQLDLLDLLPALYDRVTVPEAVVRELEEGRRRGLRLPDVAALPWLDVKRVEARAVGPRSLGPGEAEVLELAARSADVIVLLDDAVARQHAQALGLAFIGTLGVLLKARQAGFLPAVAPVLGRLDHLGFRLDPATRASVLKLAGEDESSPR